MKTILVVEDFLYARQLICNTLQRNGYATQNASSAQEAYAFLTHHGADISLVLSDVDTPTTGGFDLLRTIKSNPALENLPVVFLTADYHSDKVQFAIESGVASFIPKPIREEKFFAEINRAISTKGSIISLDA